MRKMALWAGLGAFALAGCANTTPAQQGAIVAGVVSGLACAADVSAIKGKSLKLALPAATDPQCVAALTELLNAGASPSSPVMVTPVPAPAAPGT